MLSRSAVRALMYATLSHAIFVSGLGSSCNQPLFALRPSRTYGSGRKMISMPVVTGAGTAGTPAPRERPAWAPRRRAAAANLEVPATKPS